MNATNLISLLLVAFIFSFVVSARPLSRRNLLTSSPAIDPCMITSNVLISAFNVTVTSCKQLHQGKQGIILPLDTSSVKYGGLSISGFSQPSASFIDQKGNSHSVPKSTIPSYIPSPYFVSLGQSLSQMIWKAQILKGVVQNLTLVLFVDPEALVLPFRNLTFIATIHNSPPLPDGVNPSYWSRWDFTSATEPFPSYNEKASQVPALKGTFTNLLRNVVYTPSKVSQVVICEKGLLSSQANVNEEDWFTRSVGNHSDLLLFWFPDMHMPFDSELVVVFSNQVTYMTALPTVYQLLSENINITRSYTFIIHGTPVGVLQSFTGTWSSKPSPMSC